MKNFTVLTTSHQALSLFPRSHNSLLPLILPSHQRIRQLYRLTMKLRYFPVFSQSVLWDRGIVYAADGFVGEQASGKVATI